ncbi:MATE family efflux transporter [Fusobacterium ulcerans]|uniref:MATE family efflux transporter n=1 Tax=Fusobacterium ulcerans TaxID=861 RepID=UPI0034B3BC8C
MLKIILEILKLALPAVGEMILYMMIWVLDTIMIGKHSGQLGVSAVGLSSEVMYTFSNIIVAMGLSISITSIISRAIGGKNYEKARLTSDIALRLGLIFAFLMGVIFFFFPQKILTIVGAEKDILSLAVKYMRICSIAVMCNMTTNTFNGIFRGCKNTKTPLYTAIIVNIVNLSLDYILIFGKFGAPEMGVVGGAIATVAGNICGLIFTLSQLKKIPFKINLFAPFNKEYFKELVRLTIPSSLQEGAFSINKLINVALIMALGSLSFASNQIAITIESISFMPGWGFAIACTSLTGYSIGQKDYAKAKTYINYSIYLASGIMGFFSVIFLIFPEKLISLFIKSSETEVIALGTACLMLASIEQIPIAISMVLGGALKGTGDSKTPFKIVLFTNWVIRLPLVYYFIYLRRSSVTYFWKITALQWIIEAIIIFIVYRHKWKKYYQAADLKEEIA